MGLNRYYYRAKEDEDVVMFVDWTGMGHEHEVLIATQNKVRSYLIPFLSQVDVLCVIKLELNEKEKWRNRTL